MQHPWPTALRPTTRWTVAVWVLVLGSGCRRDRVPDPVELGPLVSGPTDQVVSKLVRAHYDPQALGLKELTFTAEMSLPKQQTQVSARGRWSAGDTPEVKILQATRRGKVERQPPDPGLGQQIWTSMQYQLQNLLEGLGTGFLSRRLAAWQKLPGKSELVGDKLLLHFSEDRGETVVTVGPGYVVQRVESRSPGAMSRSMDYRHQLEGGRNLVTLGELHVRIDEKAELPPKALEAMKGSDGMRFEITYQRVRGLLLPVRLRKLTPARGDEAVVTLRYTAVKR